jgi:hypothetical protein
VCRPAVCNPFLCVSYRSLFMLTGRPICWESGVVFPVLVSFDKLISPDTFPRFITRWTDTSHADRPSTSHCIRVLLLHSVGVESGYISSTGVIDASIHRPSLSRSVVVISSCILNPDTFHRPV